MTTTPEVPIIDDVPAKGNLVVRRGIAIDRVLVRRNLDGTPIDITGQTFVGKILSADASTVLATLTITIVDGPGGRLRIFLSSATTLTLSIGPFPMYITYTTPATETFMLFLGEALVQNIVA